MTQQPEYLNSLDLARIEAAIPFHLVFLPTVDSTNDWAKSNLADGQLGISSLVVAGTQNAGRGQGDRKWVSSPGSLATTIVIENKTPADVLGLIPAAIAVAVSTAIGQNLDIEPKIKWPNDILLDRKKVAGILIEVVRHGTGKVLIIGIGINVNNQNVDAKVRQQSIEQNIAATSLAETKGERIDRSGILIDISNSIDEQLRVVEEDPTEIIASYMEQCLLVGNQISVRRPDDSVINGIAMGLDQSGALILAPCDSAEQMLIHSGRVIQF